MNDPQAEGSDGKLHRTTKILSRARRRGRRVAAVGARATAGDAGDRLAGGGTAASQRAWVDAFVRRLGELGWIEGRTVAIEYRWGEGRAERYAEIAAEFVRLKPDVIVGAGTEAAIAAKQATSSIPIVFPTAGDPIGSGLVASLATRRQRYRPVESGNRSCC